MTKRLIPVILLKNGFVVRSQTFTQHQKIGNLVSTVQRLSSWSVDELVVLNIGHQDNQSLNRHDLAIEYNAATDTELVKLISSSMFMPLSFGGGINSLEQIENLLNSGADKVVLNTAVINNPEMVRNAVTTFGSQCIVASIDAKIERSGYQTYISRGKVASGLSLSEHTLLAENLGVGEILINSIDRDGTATGFDHQLIDKTVEHTSVPVIAVGGAGNYSHFSETLIETGADAVAAANIFHFRELSYPKAKKQMLADNIDVRPMQLESKWFARTPTYDHKAAKKKIDDRLKRAQEANWSDHHPQENDNIDRCRSCMYPLSSATPMEVNSDGICMGCIQSKDKHSISDGDWAKRLEFLKTTIEEQSRRAGSDYDCVIAVSGGKDSYFQTHVIKNVLGLNPLLVTYYGNNYTDVGERNLRNMKTKFGVDHIIYSPGVDLLIKLNRLGFIITGDMNWHNHCGIATVPMKMAVNFDVPFVIWGEHGYADLCGQFSLDDFIEFTYRNRLEHFCRGYEWNYMVGLEGLTEKDLYPYKYPSDKEIDAIDLRGLYLNNYLRWDPVKQTELVISEYDFEVSDLPFERTYRTMSNLDDIHENGIHDYMKYIKFGYGRCTDHASKDIRDGRLGRSQAIDLVAKHDPVKPSDLARWLEYTGMTEDEFDRIADTFREPSIWSYKNGQWESCIKRD